MYSHEQIWRGLDLLAAQQGMTISALAKLAGLDATTFNKSKRLTPDGRSRWPSTESLLKVLNVTQISLADFDCLMSTDSLPTHSFSIPLIPLSAYKSSETLRHDREFIPIPTPVMRHSKCFGLEVDHDQWDPRVKLGQILYVASDVEIRRGDLVCLFPYQEQISPLLATFIRETSGGYDLMDWRESGTGYRLKLEEIRQFVRILAILM